MLSCELKNAPGFVFLLMDCEDAVVGCFSRIEDALETVELSISPDFHSRIRLADRLVKDHAYVVIEMTQETVEMQERIGNSYRGCISKQPLSGQPIKIADF